MIQRPQTIYLFLASVLALVACAMPLVEWTQSGTPVAVLSAFASRLPHSDGHAALCVDWCLAATLILAALADMAAVMLFRHRVRQMRVAVFSTILLVGFFAALALLACHTHLNLAADPLLTPQPDGHIGESVGSLRVRFAAVLPILSVILNILAVRGIRRDEALVRSLDRIR